MWGIVGLLQKLSTNYVSAESALIWLVVGWALLTPWIYPGRALLTLSARSILLILVSAGCNTLGAWALLAAMRSGGKVSVVVPFTALYPLVVVLVAPIVLHESISRLQGMGVLCALMAVFLLST